MKLAKRCKFCSNLILAHLTSDKLNSGNEETTGILGESTAVLLYSYKEKDSNHS